MKEREASGSGPPPEYPSDAAEFPRWRAERSAWNAARLAAAAAVRRAGAETIWRGDLADKVRERLVTREEADAEHFDHLPEERRRRYFLEADKAAARGVA